MYRQFLKNKTKTNVMFHAGKLEHNFYTTTTTTTTIFYHKYI